MHHKTISTHCLHVHYRKHGTGLVLACANDELQCSCEHNGGHSVIMVNKLNPNNMLNV